MATIQDGSALATGAAVEAASKALREVAFDNAGNPLGIANRATIAALAGGILQAGGDFRIGRVQRVDETGALRTNADSIMLLDASEGAAVDTNKWLQTTATMTITQSAAGGVLFNAAASATASNGAMHTSNRKFQLYPGAVLLYKSLVKPTTHQTNAVLELGFGTPSTSAALTATDGAHWRKDTAGQWLPIVCVNGTELLGTPINNATFIAAVPVTDYALFVVELRQSLARFSIYTQAGLLVTSQDIDFTAVGAGNPGFAATHVGVFERIWNNGTAGAAQSPLRKAMSVTLLDSACGRDYRSALAGSSLGFWQSPTLYTQTSNYANVTAPTTRTVTNTSELEATLGGHVSWNNGGTSFGANEAAASDLCLFGFTVPTPYTFVLTGARISTVNLGAANGAAIYTVEYSLAVGHNGASLAGTAPNAPRFIPLGFQSLANAAAIGATFDKDTVWNPGSPVVVGPGRHIAVVGRVIGASIATASQVIRTIATLDGYFE